MLRLSSLAGLVLAGSSAFSATILAQASSIEGRVTGTDGRPPKLGEIRFEQKGGQISPVFSRTDINGHYTAALPRGIYKMSVSERGMVKAAITVKATGANSRIDFDLRPSAEKKIRHYVWVGGETGTHLPGHWIEAGIRAGPSPIP
jgi:Carboxypeptidase regulatory-like domain